LTDNTPNPNQRPPDRTVGIGVAARTLTVNGQLVTAQTIRNQIKRGMPAEKVGDRWKINLAKAQAWLDDYASAKTHGGKRDNAGRPPEPTDDPDQTTLDGALGAAALRDEIRGRDAPPEDGADPARLLLKATDAELRVLAQNLDDVGMTKAGIDALHELAKAQARLMDNARKLGRLVDVEDVRQAYARRLVLARQSLEQAVTFLTSQAVAITGCSPDLKPKLHRAFGEQIERTLRELSEAESDLKLAEGAA